MPLTIQIGETIYTDDANLDTDKMMEDMYATTTASKSACPSPDDYMRAFEGADNIIVVTITGTLSGSHNSAQVAKKLYQEDHPTTNIHVIDSLSAGGEVDLLVRKLHQLIAQDLDFDQVVEPLSSSIKPVAKRKPFPLLLKKCLKPAIKVDISPSLTVATKNS